MTTDPSSLAAFVDIRVKHAVGEQPSWTHEDINYRLDVVAADLVDVVLSAGGWLYDRSAAGWEVNVFVAHAADLRPLQILGGRVRDLDERVCSRRRGGHGLAVSAAVFNGDTRVRDIVLDSLDSVVAGVTLSAARRHRSGRVIPQQGAGVRGRGRPGGFTSGRRQLPRIRLAAAGLAVTGGCSGCRGRRCALHRT